MDQPVAEKDIADAEALRVGPSLLLGGERINAFALGLDHGNGPLIGVQQHVIYKAVRCLLKIPAQILARGIWPAGNPMLADDVLAPPRGRRERTATPLLPEAC